MKRSQLEHIIRAAGAITNQDELIIIGSQALLGQFPDAPGELLVSVEADVFPKDRPGLSIQIDGAIGELSPFHQTFGYYAHGVDETTAQLPGGWKERLVAIQNENTRGVIGWCLEVHDLAFSKLAAGREKDVAFVRGLFDHRLIDRGTLQQRIDSPELSDDSRLTLQNRFQLVHKPGS
ncbi:MAG: hypothetical protein JXQ71_16270 [Verrucomicrobia bacterium]|nr:hypothetical protein [Verrucomicrobiota bacterium]